MDPTQQQAQPQVAPLQPSADDNQMLPPGSISARVDPLVEELKAANLNDAQREQLYDRLDQIRKSDFSDMSYVHNGTIAVLNSDAFKGMDDATKEKLYDAVDASASDPRHLAGIQNPPINAKRAAYDGLTDVATTAGAVGGTALGGPIGGAAGAGLAKLGMEEAAKASDNDDLNPQTPGQEAIGLGGAAIGGALQGIGEGVKVPTPVDQQLVNDAAKFGIPLSPGQKYGGGVKYIESFLKNAAGSKDVMKDAFGKPTNDALITTMNNLIDQVSRGGSSAGPSIVQGSAVDQAATGQIISEAIQQAKTLANSSYGNALQQIGATGADDLPLNLNGQLQQTAQKLVDRLGRSDDFDAVSSPARDKALSIAEQFANPVTTTTTPGSAGFGGSAPKTVTTPKTLTWGDARKLKMDLDDMIFNGEMTSQKQALSDLRTSLNQEMQTTLAGTPEGAQFKAASDQYANTQEQLEQNVIKRLLDNERPELAAQIMLNGGAAQSNAEQLSKIVASSPVAMPKMRAAILDNMLNTAMDPSSPDATLVGQKLLSQWQKLGPDAQHAIFNDPQMESDLDTFVKLAAKTNPKPPGSSVVGMTQAGAFGSALYLAGRAALALNPAGAVAALGEGAAVYITPRAMAYAFANAPGAVKLFNRAMTTQAGTKAASYVASQIAYLSSLYLSADPDSTGSKQPQTAPQGEQ